MTLRWFVVRTESRAEYLAASELERDGYEIFLPTVTTPNPRLGHNDVPLFPGYLFLRWDSKATGWPTFRPRHRVLGWVTFGGEVPALPDEVIDRLMQRLNSLNREGGLWRRFRPGEVVQIVAGSVQGLGEITEEAKSPQARAKVLLEFMGRMVRAQVPWENLRPVDATVQETYKLPRRTRGRKRWIRNYSIAAAAGA